MNNENVMVSVCMITYNHEKFITQAIEGVLIQKTNFPIELIIGEDCSTDSTRKIIEEYTLQNPGIIKPLYREKNIGIIPNFIATLSKCCGKYIAICEGDDYWTDPLKLQKQVDFLEENEDYIMCYHNAIIIDEHGNLISKSKLPEKMKRDFLNIVLITQTPLILTLSVCFRNLIKEVPTEMSKVLNGDTFLFSLLGSYGKGKYLDDINPAVYRRHTGGIWSMITLEEKSISSITTLFWLAQYYLRIGRNDYAHSFFEHIRYRISNMDSYENKPQQLNFAEKPESLLNRLINITFKFLKEFFHAFKPIRKVK